MLARGVAKCVTGLLTGAIIKHGLLVQDNTHLTLEIDLPGVSGFYVRTDISRSHHLEVTRVLARSDLVMLGL